MMTAKEKLRAFSREVAKQKRYYEMKANTLNGATELMSKARNIGTPQNLNDAIYMLAKHDVLRHI